MLNGKIAEELRQPLFRFPGEVCAYTPAAGVCRGALQRRRALSHGAAAQCIRVERHPTGLRTPVLRSQVAIASQPGHAKARPSRAIFRELFEIILLRDRAIAIVARPKLQLDASATNRPRGEPGHLRKSRVSVSGSRFYSVKLSLTTSLIIPTLIGRGDNTEFCGQRSLYIRSIAGTR